MTRIAYTALTQNNFRSKSHEVYFVIVNISIISQRMKGFDL